MREPDTPTVHHGGSGEPLVLIHGAMGTWRLWKPAASYLEERYEVLAVTLAGHWGGPTLEDGGEVSIYTLADAVERDMDDAGFETAHIAGGSLGTWVAFELARRGRARSVVAVAPAGGWDKGSLEWKLVAGMYWIFHPAARLLAAHAEWWTKRPRLRRFLYWSHFAHPERMDADDAAYLLRGVAGSRGHREFMTWGREHGGARGLEEIACPVLLAFPGKDFILPRKRYGQGVIDALPYAEVVDLPGLGHAAMVDDPKRIAGLITDFTNRHAADRAAATALAS